VVLACLHSDHKHPDVYEDTALVEPLEDIVLVLNLTSVNLVEHLQADIKTVGDAAEADSRIVE